jgi:hypothetical protein
MSATLRISRQGAIARQQAQNERSLLRLAELAHQQKSCVDSTALSERRNLNKMVAGCRRRAAVATELHFWSAISQCAGLMRRCCRRALNRVPAARWRVTLVGDPRDGQFE